jgi:hypothetical protein
MQVVLGIRELMEHLPLLVRSLKALSMLCRAAA